MYLWSWQIDDMAENWDPILELSADEMSERSVELWNYGGVGSSISKYYSLVLEGSTCINE